MGPQPSRPPGPQGPPDDPLNELKSLFHQQSACQQQLFELADFFEFRRCRLRGLPPSSFSRPSVELSVASAFPLSSCSEEAAGGSARLHSAVQTPRRLQNAQRQGRALQFSSEEAPLGSRECLLPRRVVSEEGEGETQETGDPASNPLPSSKEANGGRTSLAEFGVFRFSPRRLRVEPDAERLSALCRSMAIASPSCSLYGGLRGVLDYGVAGCALLNNLRSALKGHFTAASFAGPSLGSQGAADWPEAAAADEELEEAADLRDTVFLVETAALGPESLWRHSGHLELFHDEAVQCTDTGTFFRIESLAYCPPDSAAGEQEFRVACVEDVKGLHAEAGKLHAEAATAAAAGREVTSAAASAAAAPAASAPVETPQPGDSRKAKRLPSGWMPLAEAPLELYSQLPSPITGRLGALRPPRAFSLMLHVPLKGRMNSAAHGGDPANGEGGTAAILRPETAQNILVAYKALTPDALRLRLPFGLAQEGRAYRNECQGARSGFLLRLREFRQFEIEYFISPDADKDAMLSQWTEHINKFFFSLGIPPDALQAQEKEKQELPHYASRCIDFSYLMRSRNDDKTFSVSPKEICGLALRGDYDLSRHQKASRENLEFLQPPKKKENAKCNATAKVLPHVIEASIGIDRLLFATLHSAFTADGVFGRRRFFLNLHPALAPYKATVLPIVASNPQVKSLARKVYLHLRKQMFSLWDSSGSLGRRYKRADELGVPFCISVDDESVRSQTVKLRWRNTGAQIALPLAKVCSFLRQHCSFV
ncbi:hypothetical protein Efla_000239 [Eimeria flavescens]